MVEIIRLPLNQIKVDEDQPRKTFEDIKDLAKSISHQGLLEPLKVLQITENFYRLLDGERRYRALEILSKKHEEFSVANCLIMRPRGNKVIAQLSFDVQKNKIPILEEAEAYKTLVQGGYDIKELGALMGKNAGYIKGRLKISSLSDKTKDYIKNKQIPAGVLAMIDIDSLKKAEERIVERIKDEKPHGYREIERIVVEETEKVESMLYLFKGDLIKLKNRVDDFERRTKDVEAPKIESMIGESLIEANKTINNFIKNLERFEKIKEETLVIKNKLDLLLSKYGKGASLSNEMIGDAKEVNQE